MSLGRGGGGNAVAFSATLVESQSLHPNLLNPRTLGLQL